MNILNRFYSLIEKLFSFSLVFLFVVVLLLLGGLIFVIFSEISILYHLTASLPEIFGSEIPKTSSTIFLLLELVDLTLVSILIVIIATTAMNMIFKMTGKQAEKDEKNIYLSDQASMNLEAKLIFSLIGLSAVAILGTIFELSQRIEKGEFYYETIPLEYYIFGAGYILLILTSVAVIILSKAEKE